MNIKQIRKLIRESKDLLKTLEQVRDQYKLCAYGFNQDLPIEEINIWDDGEIIIYFYLMGVRRFKTQKLFSYAITELRDKKPLDKTSISNLTKYKKKDNIVLNFNQRN